MKACEFLLQREGDDTWIPVEASAVEILEGRYRILGRTCHPDQDIQIQVSYWDLEEIPPQRHSKHQTRRTNGKGLVPVLAYTHLKAGRWEIQCSSDFMADLSGQGWNDRIKLEVLPQDEATFDPTPIDDRPPAHTHPIDRPNSTITPAIGPNSIDPESTLEPVEDAAARLQELAAKMSQLVVDSVLGFGDTDPTNPIDPIDHPTDPTDPTNSRLIPPPPATSQPSQPQLRDTNEPLVQIVLGEEVYMAQRGQGLALTGAVQPLVADTWDPTIAVVVRLELRDPETWDVIVGLQQTLPPFPDQTPFSFDWVFPADCTLPLVLGEIQVCCPAATLPQHEVPETSASTTPNSPTSSTPSPLATDPQSLICVGRQNFSITASPLDILEQVQHNLETAALSIADPTPELHPDPQSVPNPDPQPAQLKTILQEFAEANAQALIEGDQTAIDQTIGDQTTRPQSPDLGAAIDPGTAIDPDNAINPGTSGSQTSNPKSADQPPAAPSRSLNLDFLKFVQQPPTSNASNWQPAPPKAVPPRLGSRWPRDVMDPPLAPPSPQALPPKDGLDLPNFPKPTPAPAASSPSAPDPNPWEEDLGALHDPTHDATSDFGGNFHSSANNSSDNSSDRDLRPDSNPGDFDRPAPVQETSPDPWDQLTIDSIHSDLSLTDTFNLDADPSPDPHPEAPHPVDFAAEQPEAQQSEAQQSEAQPPNNPNETSSTEAPPPPNFEAIFQSRFFQRLSALALEDSQDWLSGDLEEVPATDASEALSSTEAQDDGADPTNLPLSDLLDSPPGLTPVDTVDTASLDAHSLDTTSLETQDLETQDLDTHNLDFTDLDAANLDTANLDTSNLEAADAGNDRDHTDRPSAELDELADPFTPTDSGDWNQLADLDPLSLETPLPIDTPLPNSTEEELPDHLHLEALPDPRASLDLEVVVEDDRQDFGHQSWLQLTEPLTEAFPLDLPLPLPRLELPQGEWVSGQTVPVSLFLPETLAQLCVRLWMVDCQSRTVVGDPLWITRFLPTLPGFLEARFDLPVPEGCLEIQVEAMTIEPTTQRESHKISMHRSIVPAELAQTDPTGLLEAFEPWTTPTPSLNPSPTDTSPSFPTPSNSPSLLLHSPNK